MSSTILIILFCTASAVINLAMGEESLNSGPYVSIPLQSGHCLRQNQSEPYQKNPVVSFDGELYKSAEGIMRIKGNITFYRSMANTKVKVRLYQKEGEKWQIIYIMDAKSCQGKVSSTAMWALGLSFDTKKCTVKKGTFTIDVDPNQIEHMWSPTRTYGMMMWMVRVMAGREITLCWQHKMLVQPLTNPKNKN